jgi:hypothetical protein
VAIGDNSPFAIAANQNENQCTSDGEEYNVPTTANDDDGLSNVVVPRKKPARPMEPEPQEPKQPTRTYTVYIFILCVFISIVRRRTIEM